MKRILAMILCLAMVLVVFLMAGCDKTPPEDTTKAPDNSKLHGFEDVDLCGQTF